MGDVHPMGPSNPLKKQLKQTKVSIESWLASRAHYVMVYNDPYING